jgi:uncharacterized protein
MAAIRRGRPDRTLLAALTAIAAVTIWAPLLPAQAAEENAFVVLMAEDTFAVENVSRTTDGITGEMTGAAIGRLVYSIDLGPAATVRRLTLRAWPPGASDETAPMQEARLEVRDDSVIVDIESAGTTTTQRFGSSEGVIPYLNPSFLTMEQALIRGRALEGNRVEVPLFMVQGGQTMTAAVTFSGTDSATLAFAGVQVEATVDRTGRILSAAIPAQRLRVTRVDGRHVAALTAEPPDYSAPDDAPYRAENVVVSTPDGHALAGTLTLPRSTTRLPAVVMITGSGAQDRDQAIPMVRGYRPFREIADTLSRRGVAVLRLDDRGFGASTGDFASASSADFAEDIRAALAYLRGRPDIDGDRLGLVGHSEGGLIAPMVAATDPGLQGIVLVAGPAQTGREIISYQQRYAIQHADGIRPEARDSAFFAAQEMLEEHADRQPWLRYFLDHDPLSVARQVAGVPVLILHGETDRQVTVEQAEVLAAAFREAGNLDVTVQTFPGVNHLMVHDPDGNPAGYVSLENRTVAPEVLGALAEWVAPRLARQ